MERAAWKGLAVLPASVPRASPVRDVTNGISMTFQVFFMDLLGFLYMRAKAKAKYFFL